VILGSGLIWATAWFFLDSIQPHVLHSDLGRYVAPTGSSYRFRSEGWAVTHYGEYGVAALANLAAAPGARVALWGDSFVAAPHVPDSDKLAQQVTRQWQNLHHSTLTGVGIGRIDRTVADYYFLIPRYEAIADFLCHVVVMGSLRDVCPDQQWFRTEPDFAFLDRDRRQPLPALRGFLAAWRLEFLWGPFWSLVGEHRNPLSRTPIRFRPGPAPATVQGPWWTWPDLAKVETAAWEFAVAALQSRTERPVVFLYAPRLPYLAEGRIVTQHPAREHARRFATVCRRFGVDFIDLSADFVEFFIATGRLPIGFANGQPGKGHYNRDGHRLIAAAVCQYVAANFPELASPGKAERGRDAVHSD
jgi:hypothetical protein